MARRVARPFSKSVYTCEIGNLDRIQIVKGWPKNGSELQD
jgi:hypothetical protein